MRLPGVLLAFVLGLLLASTTPVGTGGGAHQLSLLHPLFAHLHLVNGQLLTHEQLAQQTVAGEQRTSPGPAFGIPGGASAPEGGLGLSPTLANYAVLLPSHVAPRSVDLESMPAGREEAPPDPPPLVRSTP